MKELIEKIKEKINVEGRIMRNQTEFYRNKRTGNLNQTGREVATRSGLVIKAMREILELVEKLDEK